MPTAVGSDVHCSFLPGVAAGFSHAKPSPVTSPPTAIGTPAETAVIAPARTTSDQRAYAVPSLLVPRADARWRAHRMATNGSATTAVTFTIAPRATTTQAM